MKNNLVKETKWSSNSIISKLENNRSTLMLVDFSDNSLIALDNKAFKLLINHYKKKKQINNIEVT